MNTISSRFDEFQKPAVAKVIAAFQENIKGRYLLVIPTGGGKTRTAVKSVLALYESGVIDQDKDKVLWVAHRNYLLKQAKEDGFMQCISQVDYEGKVLFAMVGKEANQIMQTELNLRLIVLDEAHHSSDENITYRPILRNANVGILGLTATPSRNDGESLGFEKEVFSIGFPDLERKGIILKPEVRRVLTEGEYAITGFSQSELALLDTEKRNQKIIESIETGKDDYQKIVIYVGSVQHAINLCKAIRSSSLANYYESVQYIVGNSNSREVDRDEFLRLERLLKRSILVNVDVLTEGYDDPTVNTVVMARPTNSKLVYMQAMGRAIRCDKENALKKAFVVEIIDNLPNITYRIENRWLYADISDNLEPNVEDFEFSDSAGFAKIVENVFAKFNVLLQHRHIPDFDETQRYSILLFRVYQSPGLFFHIPIIIDSHNRIETQRFFNYLSERIYDYVKQGASGAVIMNSLDLTGMTSIQDPKFRTSVYQAMSNASKVVFDKKAKYGLPPKLRENEFWITFISLRQNKEILPDALLNFVEGMINREEILDRIRERLFEPGDVLFRLPLPLRDFVGRIFRQHEAQLLETVIGELVQIKSTCPLVDHRGMVRTVIHDRVLPLESTLLDSLSIIAREGQTYSYQLG